MHTISRILPWIFCLVALFALYLTFVKKFDWISFLFGSDQSTRHFLPRAKKIDDYLCEKLNEQKIGKDDVSGIRNIINAYFAALKISNMAYSADVTAGEISINYNDRYKIVFDTKTEAWNTAERMTPLS